MPVRCTSLDDEDQPCLERPVALISGGRRRGEPAAVGWRGAYCEKHAVSVLRNQMFQVPAGMPISMDPLGA